MKVKFVTRKQGIQEAYRKLQQSEKIATVSKILPSILYDEGGRPFFKTCNHEHGTIAYLNQEFIEEKLGHKIHL